MSPRSNLRVASHLGVRLPATPPTQGALDDEELFIIEGSKNPRTPGLTLLGGVRKMGQTRLQIVIKPCR